nr:mucin-2-like [Dermacentor andersoni]
MAINAIFICYLLTALLPVIARSPENKTRHDTSAQRRTPMHQVALLSEESASSGLQRSTNIVNGDLKEAIAGYQFLNSEYRSSAENVTNADRRKEKHGDKEKKHSAVRKLTPYKHQYRITQFPWRNGSVSDNATIETNRTKSHEKRVTRSNSSNYSSVTGARKLEEISYQSKAITPAQNRSKQRALSQSSWQNAESVVKKSPVTKAFRKWSSTEEIFSTDSTNLEGKVPVSRREESHGGKSSNKSAYETSSSRPLNDKKNAYAASNSIITVTEGAAAWHPEQKFTNQLIPAPQENQNTKQQARSLVGQATNAASQNTEEAMSVGRYREPFYSSNKATKEGTTQQAIVPGTSRAAPSRGIVRQNRKTPACSQAVTQHNMRRQTKSAKENSITRNTSIQTTPRMAPFGTKPGVWPTLTASSQRTPVVTSLLSTQARFHVSTPFAALPNATRSQIAFAPMSKQPKIISTTSGNQPYALRPADEKHVFQLGRTPRSSTLPTSFVPAKDIKLLPDSKVIIDKTEPSTPILATNGAISQVTMQRKLVSVSDPRPETNQARETPPFPLAPQMHITKVLHALPLGRTSAEPAFASVPDQSTQLGRPDGNMPPAVTPALQVRSQQTTSPSRFTHNTFIMASSIPMAESPLSVTASGTGNARAMPPFTGKTGARQSYVKSFVLQAAPRVNMGYGSVLQERPPVESSAAVTQPYAVRPVEQKQIIYTRTIPQMTSASASTLQAIKAKMQATPILNPAGNSQVLLKQPTNPSSAMTVPGERPRKDPARTALPLPWSIQTQKGEIAYAVPRGKPLKAPSFGEIPESLPHSTRRKANMERALPKTADNGKRKRKTENGRGNNLAIGNDAGDARECRKYQSGEEPTNASC